MNTSRRNTLKRLGCAATASATAPLVSSCNFFGNNADGQKPNVIVVLADDWAWPHASCAGDPTVHTPWFDKVVREGVLFDHAFVSAPSCAPSRAALLTGKYHWELEQAANMWGSFPKKFDCYPEVFKKQGYHVGFCKKGWSPGVIGVHGRMKNPAGQRYKSFTEYLRVRKGNSPLCFWYGSHYPHRKYEWKSGIRSGLDPESVKVPPHLPDVRPIRLDLCDYYAEVQNFDLQIGEVYTQLKEMEELENTILIVTSDNGIPFPRCKANLYDCGTRVPLCIRWPKGIRKPGRTFSGFVSLVDIAPTIYEAAGISPGEPPSGKSLMSILRRSGMQQKTESFSMELTGRERHITAQNENKYGYPMRAIRTKKYLYIRNFEPARWPAGAPPHYRDVDRSPTKSYLLEHKDDPEIAPFFARIFGKRPAEELYNVEKDPGQIENLASKPEYSEIKKELSHTLRTRLKKTEDPRILGNSEFDEYRYYMLKRVYQ